MAIQLQEFAKQVIFGTTMEAKLSFPREEIIDTQPGSAFTTPRQLTRPKHLALRDDGVRAINPHPPAASAAKKQIPISSVDPFFLLE